MKNGQILPQASFVSHKYSSFDKHTSLLWNP